MSSTDYQLKPLSQAPTRNLPPAFGTEPDLADLLGDRTLHLLLKRDRLTVDQLTAVIERWRAERSSRAILSLQAG
ncbi:MAG: hypothetical protein O2944_11805 [Proteobacteria bacterium]|nr:hypothetical protein [Pseudomonadota bacterium]